MSQACHFLGAACLLPCENQFSQVQIEQPDKSSVLLGPGGGNAGSQLLFSKDLQGSFHLTCDLSAWARGTDNTNIPFLVDPCCWLTMGLERCAKLFTFPQQNLLPSLAFCN